MNQNSFLPLRTVASTQESSFNCIVNDPIGRELIALVRNVLVKVSRLMISQLFTHASDSHSTDERANSCRLINRGIKPSGKH